MGGHTRALCVQNHFESPFENLPGAKDRQLMRAARRPNCNYAALCDFENARGVDFGRGSRRDYAVVAGHLSLQTQLAARITRQRMEKKDDGERRLKENDDRVPAFNVRQFVLNHRGALIGRRPPGDVSRQQDSWTKYAEENRRMNFCREPYTYFAHRR